jgi:hypothetical protein
MYIIREIVRCQPGKVKPLLEKFRTISTVMGEMGHGPLRLMTDVTGEPFWTLVAEATVDRIDDFFAVEQRLMANDAIRRTMGDYHELVESGRREIYRLET